MSPVVAAVQMRYIQYTSRALYDKWLYVACMYLDYVCVYI